MREEYISCPMCDQRGVLIPNPHFRGAECRECGECIEWVTPFLWRIKNYKAVGDD